MQRWHGVFCLLSLDCMVPFWSEMELHVPDSHQDIVCDEARAAYLTVQGGEQSYYAARYDKASVQFAIACFKESLLKADQVLARSVVIWCERSYICGPSDGALEALWWGAMMDLKNEYPMLRNPLQLPDEKVAVLVKKVQDSLVNAYESLNQRLARIDRNLLSDWDKEIYRATSTGSVHEAPVDNIRSQVLHRQFFQFWSEVELVLSQPEVQHLFDWYQKQNAHMLTRWRPHLRRLPGSRASERRAQ